MAKMKVVCWKCGKAYWADGTSRGKKAKCGCGETFVVGGSRSTQDSKLDPLEMELLFDRPSSHSHDASANAKTFPDSSTNHSSSRPELTTCENCGRSIGALESTHEYGGHVVCQECVSLLQAHATPTVAPQKTPTPKRGEIICPNPNCGYVGKPKKQPRGSLAFGFLLTLLMILPGLIYFALLSGYTYICPKCGVEIRSGTHN